MPRWTLVPLSLLAALGLGLAGSAPANASSSPLHLSWAHPNSTGSDTRTNANLNDEWVKIGNYSYTTTYNLSGYTLKDASGHTYRFPTSFRLSPRKSVEVHTGSGTNTSANLYWGSGAYIWNNTGDTAYLRTASGYLNSTCRWGSVANSVTVAC